MALTKATQNVISPNICTTDTTQTISGAKTFSSVINGSVSGSASHLSPSKTIAISGDVFSSPVVFDGTSNVTIPTALASGVAISSPNIVNPSIVSPAITGGTIASSSVSASTITSSTISGSTIADANFSGTPTGFLPSTIIKGVTDGSVAQAGYIGEILSASQLSPVGISSNQIKDGVSLSLTPGSWEVYGNATFYFTGVTCAAGDVIGVGLSTTSGTMVSNQQQLLLCPQLSNFSGSPAGSAAYAFVTPRIRIDTSTNTTVYLVVQAPTHTLATGGSMKFTCILSANRVR